MDNRVREVAVSLALFALTVAMAAHEGWGTTDLVWSLWISSLAVGYSLILASIAGMLARGTPASMTSKQPAAVPPDRPGNARRVQFPSGCAALPLNVFVALVCASVFGASRITAVVFVFVAVSTLLAVGGMLRSRPGFPAFPDPDRGVTRVVVMLPGALFMVGFFTVHFLGFHFVHGIFLNGLFPIVRATPFGKTPEQVFGLIASCAGEAMRRYWPFVAASALSRLPAYAQAFTITGGGMLFAPYLNVVRMHAMIFVFAFLGRGRFGSSGLYALLIVYFLPLGSVLGLLRRQPPAGGRGGTAPA